MAATPKVFTTGSFLMWNSVEYPFLTGLTYNRNFDKVESTNVQTATGFKEFKPLRSEATLDATLWFDSMSADITMNVEGSLTASFGGKTYKGLATAYTVNVGGTIDGLIEQTYNFTFNGAIVSGSL
jgi:hypothetical protein